MSSFEAKYWERRYAAGQNSGSGSYGSEARWKIDKIVQLAQSAGVRSVLDFGSGDGSVAFALMERLGSDVTYRGVDISRTATAANSKRSPENMTFRMGDFTDELEQGERADLVLCLDVLFHVSTEDRLRNAVANIERSFDKLAIVTTWNEAIVGHYVGKFAQHTFYRPFVSSLVVHDVALPMNKVKSLYVLTKEPSVAESAIQALPRPSSEKKTVTRRRARVLAQPQPAPFRPQPPPVPCPVFDSPPPPDFSHIPYPVFHVESGMKTAPVDAKEKIVAPVIAPVVTPRRPRVEASLASIPERENQLRHVAARLAPQVDVLRVFLNGYGQVPGFLRDVANIVVEHSIVNIGDHGKFFWATQAKGVQFICDDDIDYTRGYVERMLSGLAHYRNQVVVGLHGIILTDPLASYYDHRLAFPFALGLAHDTFVHVLGTGCLAYHPDVVDVRFEDFEEPNMADIWMGLICQRQRVPMVALSRAPGLATPMRTEGRTIYDARGDGRLQAEIVRNNAPWRIHRPSARDGGNGEI